MEIIDDDNEMKIVLTDAFRNALIAKFSANLYLKQE